MTELKKPVPWTITNISLGLKIKRLEKKLAKEKRNYEQLYERLEKHYAFEIAVEDFINRVKKRKWNSDWPIERFDEALLHLEKMLP